MLYFNPGGETLFTPDGLRTTMEECRKSKLPPLPVWSMGRLSKIDDAPPWMLADVIGMEQLDVQGPRGLLPPRPPRRRRGDELPAQHHQLRSGQRPGHQGRPHDRRPRRRVARSELEEGLLPAPRPVLRWFPEDDSDPPAALSQPAKGRPLHSGGPGLFGRLKDVIRALTHPRSDNRHTPHPPPGPNKRPGIFPGLRITALPSADLARTCRCKDDGRKLVRRHGGAARGRGVTATGEVGCRRPQHYWLTVRNAWNAPAGAGSFTSGGGRVDHGTYRSVIAPYHDRVYFEGRVTWAALVMASRALRHGQLGLDRHRRLQLRPLLRPQPPAARAHRRLGGAR